MTRTKVDNPIAEEPLIVRTNRQLIDEYETKISWISGFIGRMGRRGAGNFLNKVLIGFRVEAIYYREFFLGFSLLPGSVIGHREAVVSVRL